MVKGIIRRIFDAAWLFEYFRRVTNMQIMKKIDEFCPVGNKTVLDVGCGTGTYSRLASKDYVGLDLNKNFIDFANQKYGNRMKRFMIEDVTKINVNRKFEVSFFFSMMHHFNDEQNSRILEKISHLSKEVYIIDLVKPRYIYHPIKRVLVELDRGDFVRPVEKQKEIIRKHLNIKKEIVFNTVVAKLSLYVCQPK
jgi:SAM-dependent methyltransferase